ncbi:MAG: hypothetical protein Fur0028_10870 [Bacteroidales bacterium]
MLPSGCYVCDAKYVVQVSFGMEICIAPNAHRLMRSIDCMQIDFIAHFYYNHARTNFMTKRVKSIYA